jgi:hypothetical protein
MLYVSDMPTCIECDDKRMRRMEEKAIERASGSPSTKPRERASPDAG